MSVPPESIEIGKCYLARGYLVAGRKALRVRKVKQIHPDGRVQFDQRRGPILPGRPWPVQGTMLLNAFALAIEREVPCEWTPETNEGKR